MTRTISRKLAAGAALLVTLTACGGAEEAETTDGAVATTDSAVPAAPAATTPAAGAFLDPNAASSQELQTAGLPAAAADAVVAGRPFSDNLAVDRVLTAQGVTEEQRDSVYARVWMPIDPNTASDEEILLIPGVGDRMLHEFEEYRPWQNVEHFRREIGKYVDATELARLESYVRLPS
jgi:DNA uptake protein ComE-like DNA-binding protein